MKRLAAMSVALWTAVPTSFPANCEEAISKSQPLKCEIGPVTKTYGNTPWLVYSCDDNQTVVVISAPENPAMPFYFMFSRHKDGYRLSGEGTGNKDATKAAFEQLKALSGLDIAALIEQTKTR